MATDDLAMQGARSLAAVVLVWFVRNILVSAPEGFPSNLPHFYSHPVSKGSSATFKLDMTCSTSCSTSCCVVQWEAANSFNVRHVDFTESMIFCFISAPIRAMFSLSSAMRRMSQKTKKRVLFYTIRPDPDGWHLTGNIYRSKFFNKSYKNLAHLALRFVSKDPNEKH